MTCPIVSHHERIDMVFVHIINLLTPIRFRDNEIDVTNGFKQGLPLLIGKVARLALLGTVEFIRRKTDHEVISQEPSPPEQIDMPVVQKIERSVRNHTSHLITALPHRPHPEESSEWHRT